MKGIKEMTKSEIERTAKDLNISEIELISQMQGILANRTPVDEKGILELHVIKMEYAKIQ